MEHFIPLFDTVQILTFSSPRDAEVLYKFIEQKSEFHHLKKLILNCQDLTKFQLDSVDGVLNKLEYLGMICCATNDKFMDNLLCRIPNIKHLYLYLKCIGNKWLTRCYPTLEHFEITGRSFVSISNFLALNPNIQKFGGDLRYVRENIHLIKADGIKLEDLAILIGGMINNGGNRHWQLLDHGDVL